MTRIRIFLGALLTSCTVTPSPARQDGSVGQRSWAESGSHALVPPVAFASQESPRSNRDSRVLFGVGLTEGPDTLLLGGELDFPVNDRFVIGPMIQLGVDDHSTLLAASLHGKCLFPLEHAQGSPAWTPFVQGGLGLAYLSKDRPGDDTDLGLLVQAGGGIEVRFENQLGIASSFLVDFLPSEVLGERVYVSWQIVQLGFSF